MKLMLKNVQKKQQDATNLPACSQAITTPSSRDLLLGKRWEQIAASPVREQQCYAFQTFSLRTTVSRVVASRTIIIIVQGIYKPFLEMVLESLKEREDGPTFSHMLMPTTVEPTSVLASP
jgi:hypothetical protein